MQYNLLQGETRMPRLKGSGDLLEDRRRRALALWSTGLSLNEVGRRIRCGTQFGARAGCERGRAGAWTTASRITEHRVRVRRALPSRHVGRRCITGTAASRSPKPAPWSAMRKGSKCWKRRMAANKKNARRLGSRYPVHCPVSSLYYCDLGRGSLVSEAALLDILVLPR